MTKLALSNHKYVLKGGVTYEITGSNDIITAAQGDIIYVYGNKNTITAAANDFIGVTGNGNKITAALGNSIVVSGSGNTVYSVDSLIVDFPGNNNTLKLSSSGSISVSEFNQTDTLDLSNTDIYNRTILTNDTSISHADDVLNTFDYSYLNYNGGKGQAIMYGFLEVAKNAVFAKAVLTAGQSYTFTTGGGYNIVAAKNDTITVGGNGARGELDTISGLSGGKVSLLHDSNVKIQSKDYTAKEVDLAGDDSLTLSGNNYKIMHGGSDSIFGFNSTDTLDVSNLGIKTRTELAANTKFVSAEPGIHAFAEIFSPTSNTGFIVLDGVTNLTQIAHVLYAHT